MGCSCWPAIRFQKPLTTTRGKSKRMIHATEPTSVWTGAGLDSIRLIDSEPVSVMRCLSDPARSSLAIPAVWLDLLLVDGMSKELCRFNLDFHSVLRRRTSTTQVLSFPNMQIALPME